MSFSFIHILHLSSKLKLINLKYVLGYGPSKALVAYGQILLHL